jgi:type I restriction enzyme S subunit
MSSEWPTVRLGDVLKLSIDKVAVRPTATYPIAGVYSFGRGLFHREAISGSDTAYPALHRLGEGQLVLSRLKAWEGAIAPVTTPFVGSFLSPEFPTFTPTEDVLLGYLTLLCQQPDLWELLRRRAVGVGGRKSRVKAKVFLDTEVVLPPVEDQRRILDIASAFDAVISATGALADAASRVATALSHDLLQVDHEMMPLGDAVELMLGRQVSQARRPGDRMLPYLRAANVQDGYVRADDVKQMPFIDKEVERFKLRPGDVLVQEGGTPPGTTAPWRGEIAGDVCIQNSVIRLRARPGVTTTPFVDVLARWCHDTGRFAAQGRRTHGIAHLGLGRAASILVPVPTLEVQEQLSETIASARAAGEAAAKQRGAAEKARAAIVSALLSGRHEIPSSYDDRLRKSRNEAAA